MKPTAVLNAAIRLLVTVFGWVKTAFSWVNENLLPGFLTDMLHGAAQSHVDWTRDHFGVIGQLDRADSQDIFHQSGYFNVPNLRNASGHDASLNVVTRLLASLGLPFLSMARESRLDAMKTMSLNGSRSGALQALIDLLDNTSGYPAKDTADLRQQLFPQAPANADLDVVGVLLQLLNCFNRSSLDRFKSFVERVRVCPRKNCHPYHGANYPTLNYVSRLGEVSVYVWSEDDGNYNQRHDDCQHARIADFDEHPSSIAGSFRNVGDARRDKLQYCSNPQCDIKNNIPDGVECRVRERLNAAKPVAELPRWQFIQCRTNIRNPAEPNDHPDNKADFDALRVTPHETLDLHSFYEKTSGNPQGQPTWNTQHSKTYKLRGYVVMSRRTYRHIAWRTSFTVDNATRYLHCTDNYVHFISEEEYKKPDQKILLLVYETAPAPPAPTSSSQRSDPPQCNLTARKRIRIV